MGSLVESSAAKINSTEQVKVVSSTSEHIYTNGRRPNEFYATKTKKISEANSYKNGWSHLFEYSYYLGAYKALFGQIFFQYIKQNNGWFYLQRSCGVKYI